MHAAFDAVATGVVGLMPAPPSPEHDASLSRTSSGIMSGFVAIFDPAHSATDDTDLTLMLGALAARGDRLQVWRATDAILAAVRFDWEMADELAGPTLVLNDGDICVVADASLYYRDDVVQKLAAAGVRPRGRTAVHLIAAAYRAWGADCARHLEGDFAFVVFDARARRVVAARDFMGRRPLYWAHVEGTFFVASSVSAIVAHSKCPKTFDELALGELIGVSLAGHDRTPYESVKALPPASQLTRAASAEPSTTAYWRLRLEETAEERSLDEAAERLRALLDAAIVERRAPSGPTTIWLSGGYDSPVIFGIGNAAMDRLHLDRLAPVSFSYPVGDPGREDELIDEVTTFWRTRPRWLSIDDVPLLRDAHAHASKADIPFQHAFENWLRALLAATREQGSRVALYGDGGDQLFAVSTVFLRDLFAEGQWRALLREWRAFGGGGLSPFWHSIARPVFAERRRRRAGRPAIALPAWLADDFTRRHDIVGRQVAIEAALSADGGGRADAETRRSLINPTIPRVLTGFSALALEYSIELRAPLLDQRVVEFAARRPRAERASAGAVKHLLRRAARDVVPASVLAPRKAKTGVLTDYFARSFKADPDGTVSDAFANSRLADMGIVDAAAMQQAWREYQTGTGGAGGHLFVAFQTELWLRTRRQTTVVRTDEVRRLTSVPTAGFVQ